MIEKSKQLSLKQRIKIEEILNQRHRKFEIANELDKSQSTIAREFNKHRIIKPHNILKNDNTYNCKYFINCKVCTGKGVNLNTSELIELAHIICPLVKKRSVNIYHIK